MVPVRRSCWSVVPQSVCLYWPLPHKYHYLSSLEFMPVLWRSNLLCVIPAAPLSAAAVAVPALDDHFVRVEYCY